MNNVPQTSPPAAVLRQVLLCVTPTAAEFDLLLLDHLPQFRQKVPSGGSLEARIIALLDLALHSQLWEVLRTHYGPQLEALTELWEKLDESAPCSPELQQLKRRQRELQTALNVLKTHPGGSSEIETELRDLRARLKPAARLQAGMVLGGRYELREHLGSGSVADVWLALDRGQPGASHEERRVALKILKPQHQAPATRERFRRGAQLMWQLRHPNIVSLLSEPQELDGYLLFPMQYMQGGTLQDRMQQGSIPCSDLLSWFADIAAALQFAHDTLVPIDGEYTRCKAHRDIWPRNILFDHNGRVYLIDFDLTLFEHQYFSGNQPIAGNLNYAAPECIDYEAKATPDRRADVFSLALVMLIALTGSKLRLSSRESTIKQLIAGLPYGDKVKAVFTKALKCEREQRYSSVAELSHALRDAFAASRLLASLRRFAWAALIPVSFLGSAAYGHARPLAGQQTLSWARTVLGLPSQPPPVVASLPPPSPTAPPVQRPSPPVAPPEPEPAPLPEPESQVSLARKLPLPTAPPAVSPQVSQPGPWLPPGVLPPVQTLSESGRQKPRADRVALQPSDSPVQPAKVLRVASSRPGPARALSPPRLPALAGLSDDDPLDHNNRQIGNKALAMKLCKCLCTPPGQAKPSSWRNLHMSPMFTLPEASAELSYHPIVPAESTYWLQSACVKEELRHHVTNLPFPHSKLKILVENNCVGTWTGDLSCDSPG